MGIYDSNDDYIIIFEKHQIQSMSGLEHIKALPMQKEHYIILFSESSCKSSHKNPYTIKF